MKETIRKILHLLKPNKMVVFNDLNLNVPISPYFGTDRGMPIDRYFIEKFLRANAHLIQGVVGEIAENSYSKKFGNDTCTYEILHVDTNNKKATITGDLSKLDTLPEKRWDAFICTQTLNFIYDVKKAVEGSHFILKNGGVFLGTVAGISQISRFDMDRWGDYWRFTSLSVKRMFEEVYGAGNVELTIYGNVLASVAFLQGMALEDLPKPELLDAVDEDYQMLIGIKAIKKI